MPRPWYVTLTLKIGLFAIAIQAATAAGILVGILASLFSLIAIALGVFAMLELQLWVDFHWPESTRE